MDQSLYRLYQDLEYGHYYRIDPLSNLIGLATTKMNQDVMRHAQQGMMETARTDNEIRQAYQKMGHKATITPPPVVGGSKALVVKNDFPKAKFFLNREALSGLKRLKN